MKRVRVGLRLLLLLVALFAVVFAWIGARRELERVELRGSIRRMEISRDYAAGRLDHPAEGAFWQKSMMEMDAMIEAERKQLGDANH